VLTLCGLRLALVVVLRWPDHVVPPCVALAVVVLRSVVMAVPPCVVLVVMSLLAAVTAGRIMAAGIARVLWLPVLPWVLRHRQPTTLVIRTIIRRLTKSRVRLMV